MLATALVHQLAHAVELGFLGEAEEADGVRKGGRAHVEQLQQRLLSLLVLRRVVRVGQVLQDLDKRKRNSPYPQGIAVYEAPLQEHG